MSFLQHYGVGHEDGGNSGRYRWGTGKKWETRKLNKKVQKAKNDYSHKKETLKIERESSDALHKKQLEEIKNNKRLEPEVKESLIRKEKEAYERFSKGREFVEKEIDMSHEILMKDLLSDPELGKAVKKGMDFWNSLSEDDKDAMSEYMDEFLGYHYAMYEYDGAFPGRYAWGSGKK